MRLHKSVFIAVLALGSLLFCTQLSSAQDAKEGKKRGGMDPKQRAEQLSTRLELNADQKAKVTTLFEAEGKKMQELRADQNMSREDRREKFRTMREETNKQLKTILTPAQWDKYEKMREEMRSRAQEKKGEAKKKAE